MQKHNSKLRVDCAIILALSQSANHDYCLVLFYGYEQEKQTYPDSPTGRSLITVNNIGYSHRSFLIPTLFFPFLFYSIWYFLFLQLLLFRKKVIPIDCHFGTPERFSKHIHVVHGVT